MHGNSKAYKTIRHYVPEAKRPLNNAAAMLAVRRGADPDELVRQCGIMARMANSPIVGLGRPYTDEELLVLAKHESL